AKMTRYDCYAPIGILEDAMIACCSHVAPASPLQGFDEFANLKGQDPGYEIVLWPHMLGLVEADFTPAREPDFRNGSPACFHHVRALDSFASQARHLILQVIAHQAKSHAGLSRRDETMPPPAEAQRSATHGRRPPMQIPECRERTRDPPPHSCCRSLH